MSITSTTFPGGTAINAPEVEQEIADYVRKMPKNQDKWLVTVCVYANRTEVLRHLHPHPGLRAVAEAMDEAKNVAVMHWRLAAWSDLYTYADIASLKVLER